MRRDPTSTAATKLTGTVRAILDGKDGAIRSIGPSETVYAAVAKLKEWSVGALLVMQDSQLVGMFSERDYAHKIILEGRASKSTRVEEIMTSPVIYVTLSTPLPECMRLMTERRIRHLPVIEQDQVVLATNGKAAAINAIGGHVDDVTVLAQPLHQIVGQALVVLDDQQFHGTRC